jgi:hypothetical protein
VEKDGTPTEMQRSKYSFLSSQVLMDLEEIYMDPFWAVDSSSGRDRLRMLKLPGTSTGSRSLTIADDQSRKLLACSAERNKLSVLRLEMQGLVVCVLNR